MAKFKALLVNERAYHLSRIDASGQPTGDIVSVVVSMADPRRVPGVEAYRMPDGSLTEVTVDTFLSPELVKRVLTALHDEHVELYQV